LFERNHIVTAFTTVPSGRPANSTCLSFHVHLDVPHTSAIMSVSTFYRGADKSLARPGRKQATFPAFCGTWRFITAFTRVHHLFLP